MADCDGRAKGPQLAPRHFARRQPQFKKIPEEVLSGCSLPPLAYRLGVNPVMAVRIEPQPAPEARVARELFLRHGLQVVDEPDVDLVELR
jgi:hypothetical protein